MDAVPSACQIISTYNKFYQPMHQRDGGLFDFVLCDRIFIWMHKTNNTICTGVWQGVGVCFSCGSECFNSALSPLLFTAWLAQLFSFFFLTAKPKQAIFEAELIKMPVLIQGEAASGFTDKGDRASSMGNLTRVSWETSLALVCGQLFALQSNVPSEMHDCSCNRDDQIQKESRQPQNSTVM